MAENVIDLNQYVKLALRTEKPYDAAMFFTRMTDGTYGPLDPVAAECLPARARWLVVHPELFRMHHAVYGVIGELAEMLQSNGSFENAKEEIGDGLWYAALLWDALRRLPADLCKNKARAVVPGYEEFPSFAVLFAAGTVYEVEMVDAHAGLATGCGIIADALKRQTIYAGFSGTPKGIPHEECFRALCHITCGLRKLAAGINVPLTVIADENIKKLRARFPDKFDNEASENRDYGKEAAAVLDVMKIDPALGADLPKVGYSPVRVDRNPRAG